MVEVVVGRLGFWCVDSSKCWANNTHRMQPFKAMVLRQASRTGFDLDGSMDPSMLLLR